MFSMILSSERERGREGTGGEGREERRGEERDEREEEREEKGRGGEGRMHSLDGISTELEAWKLFCKYFR